MTIKLYDNNNIGGGGGSRNVSPIETYRPICQAKYTRDAWINFQILTFLKVNNFNNLIKLSLGGGKNMTKKELQEQNKQLKATIEKMERRIVRLKARINDLQKIAAIGRRGLPWR